MRNETHTKPLDRLRTWRDSLGETSTPLFGQLSLWALLILSASLVISTELNPVEKTASETVSLLGYLVPETLLDSRVVFEFCRIGFFVAAACWFFRRLVPYSGWLTLFFYTMVTSAYCESLPCFPDKYVLPCWLLGVYALWFHFYGDEIRAASRSEEFWTTPLFPKWVHSVSIYSVAMFYTFSGFSKLLESGFQWGDGLSLQIWTKLLADGNSPLTSFLLTHRVSAMIVQSGILLLECLAFLAIFSRECRVVIGIGLICCSIAVLPVFGLGALVNITLFGLFFLPLFDWAPTLFPRVKAAIEYSFNY